MLYRNRIDHDFYCGQVKKLQGARAKVWALLATIMAVGTRIENDCAKRNFYHKAGWILWHMWLDEYNLRNERKRARRSEHRSNICIAEAEAQLGDLIADNL